MKKTIVGILSFAVLMVAQVALAGAVWNGASNDCKGISVANHTTNTGIINPCWPLSSVSSNAGDSVNVRIYYHNTSGQPATNVRVSLDAPTASSSTHTFSGQILSDQGNLSLGSVTVSTPVGSKLVYGGAHWLPNQSQTESSLLYGQKGSEVLSSGLNIGTINSSWAAQGSVVVSFLVEKPNPTGNITAAQSSCLISAGQGNCTIPFSWNTFNPIGISSVIKDGLSGTYKTGNSDSNVPFVIPFGTSVFRLFNNNSELDSESVSASCASGTNWDSYTSSCKTPLNDCEIVNFIASPKEIALGQGSTLSWTTNYCKFVSIGGVGSNLPPNSSIIVYPTGVKTYVLTGYGDTQVSPTKSVEIIAGGPAGAPGYPAGAPSYGY